MLEFPKMLLAAKREILNSSSSLAVTRLSKRASSSLLASRVEEFARRTATPVRLEELYRLGRGVGQERFHFAQLVRSEVAIRNAQLCKELLLLPFGLPETKGVQDIVSHFSSYVDWLDNLPPPETAEEDKDLTKLLTKILKDNSDVTRTLGHAVLEVRESLGDTRWEEIRSEVDLILDRFFMKRIGLRFLIQHHIASATQVPGVSGIIHSSVSVGQILRDVASEARAVCEEEWGVAPQIHVVGDGDNLPSHHLAIQGNVDLMHNRQFTYVPIHLRFLAFEVLLNACQAVARRWFAKQQQEQNELLLSMAASASKSPSESSLTNPLASKSPVMGLGRAAVAGLPIARAAGKRQPREGEANLGGNRRLGPQGIPPVRAIFAHGSNEVSLKISDEGGGIPRSDLQQAWSYFDAPNGDLDELLEARSSDFLERGYRGNLGAGLPLARLHARYYGGDIVLRSLEGLGTDVYVFMRRLGNECENLPRGVRISPAQSDSSMGQAASISLLEALGGTLNEEEVKFLNRRLDEYRFEAPL
eukprot:TRINITY_DN8610_c0_g1_i1.p1 TRINITY_DN8610_c0_g1~~TRINITY_DN8610_c0_g1_i1.p1  ORF type:complete len:531 (-),score=103.10 TRINITY_DN8610_c0_g1_i1:137-1729(-)